MEEAQSIPQPEKCKDRRAQGSLSLLRFGSHVNSRYAHAFTIMIIAFFNTSIQTLVNFDFRTIAAMIHCFRIYL